MVSFEITWGCQYFYFLHIGLKTKQRKEGREIWDGGLGVRGRGGINK